jgi:hypothetical protein
VVYPENAARWYDLEKYQKKSLSALRADRENLT